MLQNASHVFMQEIGSGCFHKIHSSDEMDNAQLFNLAIRRKHFWWSRHSYEPQPYALSDILEGAPLPDIPVTTALEIDNFQCNSDCKLSGKVGASLASIMNLSVEALESISFNLPLGNITKKAVDLEKLVVNLQDRKVNLSHPMVQQCFENKARISVVTETLCISKDVEISASANLKDDASAKTNKVVDADGSVDYIRKRVTKLTLLSGSTIVFQCLDLTINHDTGAIYCKLEGSDSWKGCCCRSTAVDNQPDDSNCLLPAEIEPWFEISFDLLSQLRSALLKFCERPLIVHGLREEFPDGKEKCPSLCGAERCSWEAAVTQASAQISPAELRLSLAAILESLISVPDEALLQLPLLSLEQARALFALVLRHVPHPADISADADGRTVQESAACTELARVLKLRALATGATEFDGDLLTLEAFGRALFALFPLQN